MTILIVNRRTNERCTVVRGGGFEDEEYHNNIFEKFRQSELIEVPRDLWMSWEF